MIVQLDECDGCEYFGEGCLGIVIVFDKQLGEIPGCPDRPKEEAS